MAAGKGHQRSIGRRMSINGKLGVTPIGRTQTCIHTNTQPQAHAHMHTTTTEQHMERVVLGPHTDTSHSGLRRNPTAHPATINPSRDSVKTIISELFIYWSGIVKKRKEKISFSIRKLLTSWHNAINAKNTLKTYSFWPTQPFWMPQSTAYALFFPVDESAKAARKISKNDNQTYLRTSKQSAVTAQQEENFPQPAIKRYKKEKNNMLEKRSMFSFFCAAYHRHGG